MSLLGAFAGGLGLIGPPFFNPDIIQINSSDVSTTVVSGPSTEVDMFRDQGYYGLSLGAFSPRRGTLLNNEQNGLPMVQFDGVNTRYESINVPTFNAWKPLRNGAAGCFWHIVAKFNTPAANYTAFWVQSDGGGGAQTFRMIIDTNNKPAILTDPQDTGSGTTLSVPANAMPNGGAVVYSGILNWVGDGVKPVYRGYYNGVEEVENSVSLVSGSLGELTAQDAQFIRLGSLFGGDAQKMDAKLGEFHFGFVPASDDANEYDDIFAQIEDELIYDAENLATKWGVS